MTTHPGEIDLLLTCREGNVDALQEILNKYHVLQRNTESDHDSCCHGNVNNDDNDNDNNDDNDNENENDDQSSFNINAEDSLGETALHMCAHYGHVDCMRVLLQHGANPRARTIISDATPLHFAAAAAVAMNDYPPSEQVVVSTNNNVDDESDNESNVSVVERPHRKRDVAVIQLLLQHYDSIDDVNATTTEGQTALHMAASYGWSDALRLLLQAGANPNVVDWVYGSTPWTAACQSHDLDCMQAFLEYAATANDPNDKFTLDPTDPLHWQATDGYTPLHVALQEGRVQEVEFWLHPLLNSKKERDFPGARKVDPNTDPAALVLRARCGQTWINAPATTDGGTPLQCAVAHAPQCLALLLQAGADPAVSDADGWTAWHWAADEGCLTTWQLLTRTVASRRFKNNDNYNHNNNGFSGGGWTDARTADNETCLHVAARAGHADLLAHMIRQVQRQQSQEKAAVAYEEKVQREDVLHCKEPSCLSALLNVRSHGGQQTVLHVACLTATPAVIRLLVQAAGGDGASSSLTNRDAAGMNAFQYAKLRKQWDSLYVLVHFYAVAGGGFQQPRRRAHR